METIELNTSWLNGKYEEGEINTSLPYVSFGDFYAQGDEADRIINEIHQIWLSCDITTQGAVTHWIGLYL